MAYSVNNSIKILTDEYEHLLELPLRESSKVLKIVKFLCIFSAPDYIIVIVAAVIEMCETSLT